jgi:hypothetical protein
MTIAAMPIAPAIAWGMRSGAVARTPSRAMSTVANRLRKRGGAACVAMPRP